MASILLIDDEKNIRTMAAAALRHVGHEVETAADGEEGLLRFGHGQGWDLTLLDHRMPGRQGLQVLGEIRRRDPNARVVIITAFGTVELAVEAMKGGATDFLRKPFTVETLRQTVTAALQPRQMESPSTQPSLPHTTYAMTTLNGFSFESEPDSQVVGDDGMVNSFRVLSPDGTSRQVSVKLSGILVEQVRARLGEGGLDIRPRFWHAVCEECLADYIWQSAGTPPQDVLHVTGIGENLNQWLEKLVPSRC